MDVPDKQETPESSGGDEEAGQNEETGQESRFTCWPIAIEIRLYFVLISELPPYFKLGAVPYSVFEDGINPGVIIGVKESRVRGCVLLAFASLDAQSSALAYLLDLQERRVERVIKTFSGRGELQFWTCKVSLFGEQDVICSPTSEAAYLALKYLKDTWTYVNPGEVPLTVCVTPIRIDVQRHLLATDLTALWSFFAQVASNVAIAAIQVAVSPSKTVTLYVFDQDSVGHLEHMIKELEGVQISEDNSFRRMLIQSPVLYALHPKVLHQGLVLGPGPWPTADLDVGAVHCSRVHTLLAMRTPANEFTVCCYMDSISFGDDLEVPWTSASLNGAMWTVAFAKRYIGFLVLNKFRDEFKRILDSHQCKLLHQYPGIDPFNKICAGMIGVTLQGPNTQSVYDAGTAVLGLAKQIEQRLVFCLVPFEQPYLDSLLKFEDGLNNPHVFIEKPPVNSHRLPPVLCRAEMSCRVGSGMSRKVVQIDMVPRYRVPEADVDALVVFPGLTLTLAADAGSSAVRTGRATVLSERQAYLATTDGHGRESPVLGSGCLMAPALIYTRIYHGEDNQFLESVRKCIYYGLLASKRIHAKSVAFSFPGIKNKMKILWDQWFYIVCKEIAIDLTMDTLLKRILIATPGDSEDLHKCFISALTKATQQEELDKAHLEFRIIQNKPPDVQVRCPLPAASVLLVGTSKDDLQQAERALESKLPIALATRHIPCPTVTCSHVTRQWRKCQMDVKSGCVLIEKTDQPHVLQLQGLNMYVDNAVKRVKSLLQDMQKDADSFEDGISTVVVSSEESSPASALSDCAVAPEELAVAATARSDFDGMTQSLASLDIEETADIPPSEDKLDTDTIERVATKGKASLRRVRGFLCGEYGAGKSSLLRALLGDEFIHNADSTKGVDVQRTLVEVLGSVCDEQACLFARFGEIKDLYNKLTAEHVHKMQEQHSSSGLEVRDDISDEFHSQPMQGLTEANRILSTKFADLSSKLQPTTIPQPVRQVMPLTHPQQVSSYANLMHDNVSSPVSFPVVDTYQQKFLFLQQDLLPGIRNELEKIRDSPDDMTVERICVELWDCGGQMAMTTQQSVCFDTTRSFFMLLFDVSKGLDDVVGEEVIYHKGKKISIPPLFEGMTHRDFLLMWLSIISLRQQRHAPGGAQQGDGRHPEMTQVFLIGSHIDKVVGEPQETIKAVRRAVEVISEKTYGTAIKLNGPYFVDNRRIADSVSELSDMKTLQDDIRNAVCSVPADEVPLTWMKLEDALYMFQKRDPSFPDHSTGESDSGPDGSLGSRTHLTYEEFQGLAKFLTKNGMESAEISDALKYYHQLGTVICNDHVKPTPDSHIFLNTGWILQQFVQLVTSHVRDDLLPQCNLSLARDVKQLKKFGVVTQALLKCLWSDLEDSIWASLISIMCHFDLACLISPKKPNVERDAAGSKEAMSGPSYFIPFCTARNECTATLPDLQKLPALVLRFQTLFFPPPIFSRVALHCIDHLKALGPVLDFSAISFSVGDHYVRISWLPIGLKVELCSFHDNLGSAAELAHRLLRAIEACLQKLIEQGYNGLNWNPAFCCRHCGQECQDRNAGVDHPWLELPRQTVTNLQQKRRAEQNSFPIICPGCKKFTKLPEDFFYCWLANHENGSMLPCKSDPSDSVHIGMLQEAKTGANGSSAKRQPGSSFSTYHDDGVGQRSTVGTDHGGQALSPRQQQVARQLSVPSQYITDGFKSDAYRKHYVSLKEKMDPGSVRDLCFQENLITSSQRQELAYKRNCSPREHNEDLLGYLENGADDAFATFCEKILAKEETGKFRAALESFRAP